MSLVDIMWQIWLNQLLVDIFSLDAVNHTDTVNRPTCYAKLVIPA